MDADTEKALLWINPSNQTRIHHCTCIENQMIVFSIVSHVVEIQPLLLHISYSCLCTYCKSICFLVKSLTKAIFTAIFAHQGVLCVRSLGSP